MAHEALPSDLQHEPLGDPSNEGLGSWSGVCRGEDPSLTSWSAELKTENRERTQTLPVQLPPLSLLTPAPELLHCSSLQSLLLPPAEKSWTVWSSLL